MNTIELNRKFAWTEHPIVKLFANYFTDDEWNEIDRSELPQAINQESIYIGNLASFFIRLYNINQELNQDEMYKELNVTSFSQLINVFIQKELKCNANPEDAKVMHGHLDLVLIDNYLSKLVKPCIDEYFLKNGMTETILDDINKRVCLVFSLNQVIHAAVNNVGMSKTILLNYINTISLVNKNDKIDHSELYICLAKIIDLAAIIWDKTLSSDQKNEHILMYFNLEYLVFRLKDSKILDEPTPRKVLDLVNNLTYEQFIKITSTSQDSLFQHVACRSELNEFIAKIQPKLEFYCHCEMLCNNLKIAEDEPIKSVSSFNK